MVQHYDASRKGCVCLGNDHACQVAGVGDVLLKFESGSSFTLKDVRHVPQLTKSMISAVDSWMMRAITAGLVITLGRSPRVLLL